MPLFLYQSLRIDWERFIINKKEGSPMQTKYAGYMGKVMLVDLTTETVAE